MIDRIRKLFPWVLLALFLAFHLILVHKTFVVDPEGNFHSTTAGYGDIPLHLTQITKFAFNAPNLDEPIFYGGQLRYPFIVNLFSGYLLRWTGRWVFSIQAPIYFLAAVIMVFAFLIYRRFFKRGVLAAMAVIVFLLGSGWGGYGFARGAIHNHYSWSQFVDTLTTHQSSTVTRWDAKYPQQNIAYGAPLSMVLIHQRTSFIGIAGFMVSLFLLLRLLDKKKKWLAVAAGISMGILPMFHSHSFVAIAIVGAVLFAVTFLRKNYEIVRLLAISGAIAVLIAAPQLYYLIHTKDSFSATSSFLAFRVGWMIQPGIGSAVFPTGQEPTVFSLAYLKYFWINFGVIGAVFAFMLLWSIIRFHSLRQKEYFSIMILSALFLFLAVNFVRFQPWDYDNNKILVYWQFFTVGAFFCLLNELSIRKRILSIIILVLFCAAALFSGVIDMIPRWHTADKNLPVIFDRSAQEVGEYIRMNIPYEDTVLTGTSHLNPSASLAGRRAVVGYPGWLWTRGINYSRRISEVEAFYRHPSKDDKLLKEFNVGYILLDGQTRSDFGARDEDFNALFRTVLRSGYYTLYAL